MDEDSPMKRIAVRRGLRGVSVMALALLSACAVERTPPAPSCTGTELPASRLFLQQVSASGAIVRWRALNEYAVRH